MQHSLQQASHVIQANWVFPFFLDSQNDMYTPPFFDSNVKNSNDINLRFYQGHSGTFEVSCKVLCIPTWEYIGGHFTLDSPLSFDMVAMTTLFRDK